MKKRGFSLDKLILILLLVSPFYCDLYAQCINPTPAGQTQQSFCKSSSPKVADLVAQGGIIEWYDSAINGEKLSTSTLLTNGKTYYANNVQGNNCSETRLAVTVTINGNFPTGVKIFVGICSSDQPTIASLSAIGENIQWYDAQFGGNLLPANTPLLNGRTYWVQQTENGCVSNRLPTTVTVLDPPPPIVEPIQSFCSVVPPTVDDLFAVGLNILWYDSENSETPLSNTEILENGKTYWASQNTFPCESLTRKSTIANVGIPPNAGSDNSLIFCEGDLNTSNLFDLLGGNADVTGTWSGPSNLTGGYLGTFNPLINNPGNYSYTVQSNSNACPNESATISVTIIPPPLAPTTTQTTQVFCSNESATISNLMAVGTNILWYDTETSTTPLNPNLDLVNGEDYWATQTSTNSNCESLTRLKVTVSFIEPQPPTTTQTTQVFCSNESATINNLTAVGTNILWYDTETSTTPLNPSLDLVNGEDYWATQTITNSTCESANRLKVVALIVQTSPPIINESTQVFCEISNPTIKDLHTTDVTLEWFDSETSTAPLNPNLSLTNGAIYWATQTVKLSKCEGSIRLKVTVSIIQPAPPTTTQTTQVFCESENATVSNLTAIGTSIKWYDTETSTAPLNSNLTLINGKDYWATQTTTNNCESVHRLKVTVSIIQPEPPTTTQTTQVFCEGENATVSNLTAIGTSIKWYDTETSTTPLNTNLALINGEDYWASQTTTNNCESVNRLKVTVSIIQQTPPTTIQTTQMFCEGENATVSNLTAIGTSIKWYDTETSTTPLNSNLTLINGEDYWATQTNSNNCESENRLKVTVSIIQPAPPTTTQTTQIFCDGENATVSNLTAIGTSIKWYDTETSTTPLNSNLTLVNGEDYWATQTNSYNCESMNRIKIVVSINPVLSTVNEQLNLVFCENDNPTIVLLNPEGKQLNWYLDETLSTPINNFEKIKHNTNYYSTYIKNTVNCSKVLLKATVSLTKTLAPTANLQNQLFCASENPTIAFLQVNGTNIKWYSSETSTTPLVITTKLINETTYWASQSNSENCESTERLPIKSIIISPNTPTTKNSTQTFCINTSHTIADLSVNESTVNWYDSETSMIPLNINTHLIDGKDYWAEQFDLNTSCRSLTRLKITAKIINLQKPTTNASLQTFCLKDNPTISQLNINEATIVWFNSETSTIALDPSEALIDKKDYWAAQINSSINCESLERLKVTVAVVDIEKAVIETDEQSFCASELPTINQLIPSGTSIKWYASETESVPLSTSELLVHNKTYWATKFDPLTNCESSIRSKVNVSLIAPTTPIIEINGEDFCSVNNPTIADLSTKITSHNSTSINWYSSVTNGNLLGNSTLLEHNKTYYAYEIKGDCKSQTPLAVTINLEACEDYDIQIFDGFSPNGDGINDSFTISNIRKLYPNFTIEYYNRWGKLVYTANASNNDWNGKYNGTGELLPAGVYYFIIHFNSNNKKPIQNRLYLSR